MPRQPNTESGRVTLALSPATKSLLMAIAKERGFTLAQVIQYALPVYQEWLTTTEAQLRAGLREMSAARRSRKR